MIAYRLTFDAPLRLPPGQVPTIPSDTLVAALTAAYPLLFPYGDTSRFARHPPFAASSAFPFRTLSAGAREHFWPCPRTRASELEAAWLSTELFVRAAAGLAVDGERGTRLHGGALWSAQGAAGETATLWRGVRRARLGAQSRAAAWEHEVEFAPGCGLWFLATYDSRAVQERVEACLRLVADSGLGGGRALGRGTFRFQVDSAFELPAVAGVGVDAAVSAGRLVLSRYVPSAADLAHGPFGDGAAWALATRPGAAAERDATFVEAGSVLRAAAGTELEGCAYAVADAGAGGVPFVRWRSGRALAVPAALASGEGR